MKHAQTGTQVNRHVQYTDFSPLVRIKGVRFRPVSMAELREMSVATVFQDRKGKNELAPPNTVSDARLGVADPRTSVCNTCNQRLACPGHEGIIPTPPFYNARHIKELRMLLRCVCFACGGFILNKESNIKLRRIDETFPPGTDELSVNMARFKAIAEICKSDGQLRFCHKCNFVLPLWEFNLNQQIKVQAVWTEASWKYLHNLLSESPSMHIQRAIERMQIPFNAAHAREILFALMKFNPEDVQYLGLAQEGLDSWVPNGIPVLSKNFRPDLMMVSMGKDKKLDDLTWRYTNGIMRQVVPILRAMQLYFESLGEVKWSIQQMEGIGKAREKVKKVWSKRTPFHLMQVAMYKEERDVGGLLQYEPETVEVVQRLQHMCLQVMDSVVEVAKEELEGEYRDKGVEFDEEDEEHFEGLVQKAEEVLKDLKKERRKQLSTLESSYAKWVNGMGAFTPPQDIEGVQYEISDSSGVELRELEKLCVLLLKEGCVAKFVKEAHVDTAEEFAMAIRDDDMEYEPVSTPLFHKTIVNIVKDKVGPRSLASEVLTVDKIQFSTWASDLRWSVIMSRLPDNPYLPIIDRNMLHAFLYGSKDEMQIDLYEALPRAYSKLIDVRNTIYRDVNNKQKMKDIRQMKEGKEGTDRKNLEAKRVNHSGRAVNAPNPYVHPKRAVIAKYWATNFVRMERVTEFNRDLLQEAVRIGPNKIGGALSVSKGGGKPISLTHLSEEDRLNIVLDYPRTNGPEAQAQQWVVRRHLREGDMILLNRPPTLHRGSIQAFEVEIGQHEVTQVELINMQPANADCDGDEWTGIVPQDLRAIAEAKHLMSMAPNFVSSSFNAPHFGLTQDYLVGGQTLTEKGTMLTRDQYCQLLTGIHANDPGNHIPRMQRPAIMVPDKRKPGHRAVELWTGKQAFSAALEPDEMTWVSEPVTHDSVFSASGYQRNSRLTVIRQGQMLVGAINKKSFSGGGRYTYVMATAMTRGKAEACDMLARTRNVIRDFNMFIMPQCIRVKDRSVSTEARTRIDRVVTMTRNSSGLLASLATKLGVNRSVMMEAMDKIIMAMEWTTTSIVMSNMARRHWLSGDNRNTILTILTSMAKGSPANMRQLTAVLGQQRKEGVRIDTHIEGTRIAPWFQPFDTAPEAGGCVFSAFGAGLSLVNITMHAVVSRFGVVMKCKGVADIGAQTRQMGRLQEEAICNVMGGVQGSNFMIQKHYGGDSMDPTSIIRVSSKWMTLSKQEFLACIGLDAPCNQLEEYWAQVAHEQRLHTQTTLTTERIPSYVMMPWETHSTFDSTIISPEVRQWVIDKHIAETGEEEPTLGDARAELYAIIFGTPDQPVTDWMRSIRRWTSEQHLAKVTSYLAWSLNQLLVYYSTVNPWYLYPEFMQRMTQHVAEVVERAHVASGEAVGMQSVHAVSEPLTQMILNTFHTAGQGKSGASAGVSRLKECFGKTISRTPAMSVYPIKTDEASLIALNRALTSTALENAAESAYVVTDPAMEDGTTRIDSDRSIVQCDFMMNGSELDRCPEETSKYVWVPSENILRIKLNKDMLTRRRMGPSTIARCLNMFIGTKWPKGVGVTVVYSPRCAKEWVLRLRPWVQVNKELDEAVCVTVARSKMKLKQHSLESKAKRAAQTATITRKIRKAIKVSNGEIDASMIDVEKEGDAGEDETDEEVDVPMDERERDHFDKSNVDMDVLKWKEKHEESMLHTLEDPLSRVWVERLRDILMKHVRMGGVTHISDVDWESPRQVVRVMSDGSLQAREQRVLRTTGSNLRAVARIPNVDKYHTHSHDLTDVYVSLGLQATKKVAIEEAQATLESVNSSIDERHVILLIDNVTSRQVWMQANKESLEKNDLGVMKRGTFEKQLQMFEDASRYGAKDPMLGPSERLMVGQRPPVGTGAMAVLPTMDPDDRPVQTQIPMSEAAHTVTNTMVRQWKKQERRNPTQTRKNIRGEEDWTFWPAPQEEGDGKNRAATPAQGTEGVDDATLQSIDELLEFTPQPTMIAAPESEDDEAVEEAEDQEEEEEEEEEEDASRWIAARQFSGTPPLPDPEVGSKRKASDMY